MTQEEMSSDLVNFKKLRSVFEDGRYFIQGMEETEIVFLGKVVRLWSSWVNLGQSGSSVYYSEDPYMDGNPTKFYESLEQSESMIAEFIRARKEIISKQKPKYQRIVFTEFDI